MHPVDYVLIVAMCLASVGIGIFTSCTGGRQKSTSEYMMGNRQMQLMPVAISILVSFWSAISLLGSPAEMFYYGLVLVLPRNKVLLRVYPNDAGSPAEMFYYGSYYNATAIGICLACVISALAFVPLFYQLQISSIFEYLELRYGTKIMRYWSAAMYVFTFVLYLAVAQLAPAIALDAVMGIPVWIGILLIGVVSVIYTAIGGIKAVIWSDVFQSVFIFIGLIATIIKATVDSGGLGSVVMTNAAWGRFDTFNWSLDPRVRMTVWSSSIGVMFTWIPCYGPNQAAFQRFASLPTLAKAKWSILLNMIGILLLFLLLALTGYSLFAFYTLRGCDPLSNGDVRSVNQLLPHYIMHHLNIPSLPGIIMACILSGAFSTTSTVLNSQSAVTVIDFVQPHWKLTDAKATVVTKWLVVAYGILGSLIALASTSISGIPLMQIAGSFVSATSGATLGVYLLASCVPKSTWQGAFAGSLVSLALTGWICGGSFTVGGGPRMLPLETSNCTVRNVTEIVPMINMSSSDQQQLPHGMSGLYSVSFQWYGLIGSVSCFLIGLLISVPNMLDSSAVEPDEKFILPVLRSILCRRKENSDYSVPMSHTKVSRVRNANSQLSKDLPADPDEAEVILS